MKKNLKLILPAVVVVLAILLSGACFVTTQQNEYTIIRQFGAVVKIVDEPGLSMKLPFIQTSSTLPKTEMLYDLAVSDVITSDKKSMVADSFVLWRISDPLKFIQSLSGNIGNAEYRIDTIVYNSLPHRHHRLQQPKDCHLLHAAGGGHLRARRTAGPAYHGERRQHLR